MREGWSCGHCWDCMGENTGTTPYTECFHYVYLKCTNKIKHLTKERKKHQLKAVWGSRGLREAPYSGTLERWTGRKLCAGHRNSRYKTDLMCVSVSAHRSKYHKKEAGADAVISSWWKAERGGNQGCSPLEVRMGREAVQEWYNFLLLFGFCFVVDLFFFRLEKRPAWAQSEFREKQDGKSSRALLYHGV